MTNNNSLSNTTVAENISEEDITQYLSSRPDFFLGRSDLLMQLNLPHNSGQATSLVERQVSLLRERNIEMRSRLARLLDIAKDNDKLLDKTQRLVLTLLDAQTLDDLGVAINEGLLYEFNADACCVLLFDDEQNYPASNIRTLSIQGANEEIGSLLKLGKPLCGALRESELSYLFSESSQPVKSAAVLPLGKDKPKGLLAVGSFDANHFESGMGTMFLTFLGEVLLRLLPNFSN